MGSLFKNRILSLANYLVRYNKALVLKRLQQTHAAVTSNTENYKISNEVIPVFKHAAKYGDKTAFRDVHGDYTYRGLFLSSRQLCGDLSKLLDESKQERVAFLLPNDATYVIVQWACWMSGQIAVPLSDQHPPSVLDYYIKDSDAKVVVTTTEYLPVIEKVVTDSGRKLVVFDDALRALAMKAGDKQANNPKVAAGNNDVATIDAEQAGVKGDFYNNSNAMLVYTSGTTSKPKGVIISHKGLQAQVNALVSAWKWTENDVILHTLPLNHIHGIVNVLLCPLYVGARCVMLPKFETSNVWSQLLAVNMPNSERVNMYMAVPTIYMKLIHEFDQLFSKNNKIKEYIYNVCSTKMRLMVCGSAPLPTPIFNRWQEITGHKLLERYGMTETGMVLSNPLEGERVPGHVGTPLPGMEVRITSFDSGKDDMDVLVCGYPKESQVITKEPEPIEGNLQVRGDSLFQGYWNKPEENDKVFTTDGWFHTGDSVQYHDGIYKILGRSSVDIIKTGGYKVSALEVETVILGHPDIVDCAIIGLPDDTWGQKVVAVVVMKENTNIILSELREFAKESLPAYAVPAALKVVDRIPKNTMGKVNKPNIIKVLYEQDKES